MGTFSIKFSPEFPVSVNFDTIQSVMGKFPYGKSLKGLVTINLIGLLKSVHFDLIDTY